jgi:competence protein ComEA
MRAGVVFVVAALLIGQGFREWRRSHEESFQEIVRGLESRDSSVREAAAPPPAGADSGRVEAGAAASRPERTPRVPREVPVGRMDPNHAGAAELTRLPGIGPALAGRIVAERDRHGPFASPEALLRVRGIGPKTLAKIRGFLSFPNAAGGDSLAGF